MRLTSSRFCGIALALLLGAAGQPLFSQAVNANKSGPKGKQEADFHPSRVLVRFQPGASKQVLPGSGSAKNLSKDQGLVVVENPPGLSVPDAVERYKRNPNVLYAEPDFVVSAVGTTPNDALWSQQWDMTKIAAPTAWGSQTSANDVVVAVMDTGIDYTHPDLQGNLWVDPANNNNHGFTCINGTCSPGGMDDFGHGTHVAGTIGAVGNNGIGIAGINWQIQLLSCKFLDSTGSGYASDATLCFNQILALKEQGVNIRVTNNSWGGAGFSQALQDAMAEVEALGIVDICAAGNSAQNTDVAPMYPGAYNNRGIVSVLASDSNDAGAGFTNFGLASVDIAAPGVNTISTVPATGCSLCNASGYAALSGTSMATPHVAGVMAALLHKNPGLSAAQARDVILDPGSYDAVKDTLGASTSTGGRLNFAKALANPLVTSPKLNNFPNLTMPPDISTSAGAAVSITPSMSDPDGDPLRTQWAGTGAGTNSNTAWLFGWMMDSLFPSAAGNSVAFTAPTLARTATGVYELSVADGRGGGAQGTTNVTVAPASSHAAAPTGKLSVSSTTPPANSTITVNFPITAPAGGTPGWAMWVSSAHSTTGYCCLTTSSASVSLGAAGVYRIGVQAIDKQLNLSGRSTLVVNAGGATGQPPVAAVVLNQTSGPAPLTVNVDMSFSYDPDGSIQSYSINCGAGTFAQGAQASSGTCTFTSPGAYWLLLKVHDNSGNEDTMDAYVVVTPGAGGGGPVPPTVSISGPAGNATVTGNVAVSANASSQAGIQKVAFYLDSGVALGTATASPYSISWNSGSVSAGAHTLYAIATDTAGLTTTSAKVAITVDTPPAVSITSPSAGSTVAGNVTVTASATGALGIAKVDFYADSAVPMGTATASPYSISWNASTLSLGAHTIYAVATDVASLKTTSATVAINVAAAPSVSITSPGAGSGVTGSISITANASDASGVQKVDFYLDAGVLLGTSTTAPYATAWNSGTVAAGAHSLYAVATNVNGMPATSAKIPITVDTPPTVALTSPAAGATVSNTVTITATASDAVGIKKVDFYLDSGVLLGTASGLPYSISWNSANVAPGSHILYAIATNAAGMTTTSGQVSVTVATSITVSITSPAPNALVWGQVSVTASVTGSGIQKVDFYLDSVTLIGTSTTPPYSIAWNTGSATPGVHNLSAIATTTSGLSSRSSSSESVTVDAPPQVTISTQPNSSTVTKKSTLTIYAAVTPGGFPVNRVDYLLNSAVICSNTGSAGSCSWTVPAGGVKSFQIQAIAYDIMGQSGASAILTLTPH
jgi:hypothetical protein